jgi:hypothetical protein
MVDLLHELEVERLTRLGIKFEHSTVPLSVYSRTPIVASAFLRISLQKLARSVLISINGAGIPVRIGSSVKAAAHNVPIKSQIRPCGPVSENECARGNPSGAHTKYRHARYFISPNFYYRTD